MPILRNSHARRSFEFYAASSLRREAECAAHRVGRASFYNHLTCVRLTQFGLKFRGRSGKRASRFAETLFQIGFGTVKQLAS
jgi:hypothetical protein